MNKKKFALTISLILTCCLFIQGQDDTNSNDAEQEKALQRSTNTTWQANKQLSENDFVGAEADYRRAISQSTENSAAPYNLGNAYYNRESFSEAFGRFKQAGELASDKSDKHKAFHNLGNVFMKNKEYQKAVEAYKEALRNNPLDEETRYNLALAKEMLEKEKQNQQNQDQNQDQDQKDQQEQNQENKGNQEQDQDQQQQDQQQQGDQDKEENKEGEGDQKQEQQKQPEQNEGEQKKQPRPNQLSPQQIKNLLEAMQNEEKKVQEKMDAKKVKGAKIKNVKDW